MDMIPKFKTQHLQIKDRFKIKQIISWIKTLSPLETDAVHTNSDWSWPMSSKRTWIYIDLEIQQTCIKGASSLFQA